MIKIVKVTKTHTGDNEETIVLKDKINNEKAINEAQAKRAMNNIATTGVVKIDLTGMKQLTPDFVYFLVDIFRKQRDSNF